MANIPTMTRVFIPKRISRILHSIYSERVTIVYAPDGTGKTTLLRNFVRRTRPDGISVRFISSAKSTGDCFSQIISGILGKPLNEPLTDGEYHAIKWQISETKQRRNILIISDCPFAIQTMLGNRRTARLLAECKNASFVFVGSDLNDIYLTFARELQVNLIGYEQLCMNVTETAKYAEIAGINTDTEKVFNSTHGEFLGTSLCFMLDQCGEEYTDMTANERLFRAVTQHLSKEAWAALIAAAAFPDCPECVYIDTCSFPSIAEYFGNNAFQTPSIIQELDSLNRIIPLVSVNHRKCTAYLHPALKRTVKTLFYEIPENVRHDLRICFAREFRRRGEAFYGFCEYYLAGEYELAGEVRVVDGTSYLVMLNSSELLLGFVQKCPLDCQKALPRLLRVIALLMHTDVKPIVEQKFSEVIDYLRTTNDYDEISRQEMLCYAYALRTSKDSYILDKMGADIKRAYDLFKYTHRFESPAYPWCMYSPSILALIHRRGNQLITEMSQFDRFQRMYSEMLNHGRFTQNIFAGEVKYYLGDLSTGRDILNAAAKYCTDDIPATHICALFNGAKCCLFLGDYQGFFRQLSDIHRIERKYLNREEGDFAKLCLGMLRTIRGGGIEDSWYVLRTDENDIMYNRYTAPYFSMTKAAYYLSGGYYNQLTEISDIFIATAIDAGNEIAGIKLRLYSAQAHLYLDRQKTAKQLFFDAMQAVRDNNLPAAAAEVCAVYPDIFEQLKLSVSSELSETIEKVQHMGEEFRRGLETVRTYEKTYLSNVRKDNYAEHYLAPLERVIADTDELRKKLKLSSAAYSYAIMAASGVPNSEISMFFDVSIDSVKSSLKRTCAALGIKSRRELSGHIPTLK